MFHKGSQITAGPMFNRETFTAYRNAKSPDSQISSTVFGILGMIFGKVVANARDEREIAGIDASCFQRKRKSRQSACSSELGVSEV